jgi:16S rRNA (adenine1518-N6/adenine1519-N6)-dimethyltransferase
LDTSVAKRAVDFASLTKDDVVLEIGPGKGILTRLLAERAGSVIAIEKDRKFIPLLSNLAGNVEVILADAVKYPFPKFSKVVSNLPYVISSSITFKLLESRFSLGILMYQKEFADRMQAHVGSEDYSRLSVEVFRRAECRVLMNVSPAAFAPQPKVRSAIIELRPRPCPFEIKDGELFSAVTRALFSHRRKSVRNAIISEEKALEKYHLVLDNAGELLQRKAETLSPQEIEQLAEMICKCR